MRGGKPFMVGQQEFAALYDVRPSMVSQWMSRGVLDPETSLIVSGVRYWPLGFAEDFGQTTPRPKMVNTAYRQQLVDAQRPGWVARARGEVPAIVGQQEVMEIFRLPAQGNLATAIASGRFPEPDWILSGSGLWLLETVLDAAPALGRSARTLTWDVDEVVADALRGGRYEGPGSRVLPRGRWATGVGR